MGSAIYLSISTSPSNMYGDKSVCMLIYHLSFSLPSRSFILPRPSISYLPNRPTPIASSQTPPIHPIQLEIPRLQIPKHLIGIILPTNRQQPLPILFPITPKHILRQTGVVLVHISIPQPHFSSHLLRPGNDARGGGDDAFVIGFGAPQDGQIHQDQRPICLGDAEGVAAVFAEEADRGEGDGLHDQRGGDFGGVFDGFDLLGEDVEDADLQGGAVLEGGGGVMFAETAGVGCVQFDREVGESGDALGIGDVGDGCEFVEGRREGGRKGVFISVGEDVRPL